MTIWTRVLYCEASPRGDLFTLLERARGSRAIRRSDAMHLSEADARRVLAAIGETDESIDAMMAQARAAMPEPSRRADRPGHAAKH